MILNEHGVCIQNSSLTLYSYFAPSPSEWNSHARCFKSGIARPTHWLGYTNVDTQAASRRVVRVVRQAAAQAPRGRNIKGLEPAQAGFVCVAATSVALVQDMCISF
ncbi:hypothetical protein [Nostoc sp. FACHB-110]|uniref:hypothetical protein n=1 Tax=Nostoc sp. FACHB-110 TaxID=2692834 RepID=UPI001681E30F|nr:hypothetical protein [Nostoc sp. FACHB-110]MBD2437813.1 hypothetical protein [Nostoc sp. FACHB-110]